MKYYEGIETIVLNRSRHGALYDEIKVLKNLDGTYSTDTCLEKTYLKVFLEKYVIDGEEHYVCTPGRESNPECFEIEFDDIVELNGVSFLSAQKILNYLCDINREGIYREISQYFNLY